MQNLFAIKLTQLQMVRDRGYLVSEDEQQRFGSTIDTFVRSIVEAQKVHTGVKVRALLNNQYISIDGTKTMFVYYGWRDNTQVPLGVATDFIAKASGHTEAVLIVDGNLSHKALEALRNLVQTRWQIFNDKELTHNPTTHKYTPKHVLLTPEEARNKYKEMGATPANILIISPTDPIVKYYGWPLNGIVKIYRNDQIISILSEESIAYRVIWE